MMKSMRPFALLSLCAGLSVACTVNAPPVEDLQGDGFNVEGGVLNVDETKIPVVDECGDGQAVVKSGDGWACVALAGGTVAGDGLSVDGATISVDFGDGATQVASGARVDAVEDDIVGISEDVANIDGRVTNADAAISAVDGRVTNLDNEFRQLIGDQSDVLGSFFVEGCDLGRAGGLNRENGVLRVCDGVEFRPITLDALPLAGTIIADYHQDDVNVGATSWTNRVAGAATLFLGTDVGKVLPPAPGVSGIGRLNGGAAAGFAAPSGHGRLTLPARGFSIELVVSGSDTVFSHGQNDLQISFFGQMTVREHGRDSRYQSLPTAPDSNRPSHIVYVHEANDTRRLYLNGIELTLETDSSTWNGPYLSDSTLMALGSTFGAAGGAGAPLLHHRVRIHAVPLSSADVLLRCQASLAAPLNVQSCG